MPRGSSLAHDLSSVINNPRYSDIRIICQDDVLYGCRTILAARSEVFDRILFPGRRDPCPTEISFPDINSSAMKFILEFIYTGSIREEALLKPSDAIDIYHAADYFLLPDLQNCILKVTEEFLKEHDYRLALKLFNKTIEKMPLSQENNLYSLLITRIAATPLDSFSFGCFTMENLRALLTSTLNSSAYFATPEYEVFRYIILWGANQISEEATSIFEYRLPALEIAEQQFLLPQEFFLNQSEASKYYQLQASLLRLISPILTYINFSLIKPNILANVIHPLGIIPTPILLEAYRFHAELKNNSTNRRGGVSCRIDDLRWDNLACGPNIEIKDYGTRVLCANSTTVESVRGVNQLSGNGMYEWDVVVEEKSRCAWIGVCEESVDFSSYLGRQENIYVFGSDGQIWNSGKSFRYGTTFNKGSTITVHLDMTKRTCAFSIDGVRYPVAWSNLPDKLYPAAAIWKFGRLRIKPHT
ncbi:10736_t:CDS:1 [Ambispora gerdemannii]|uniref:10736_t:CDS:1 n=1 Tax=Ambispora gerdemannii TaxID=144530 RepID=A0A9N9BAL9_9GLOM|nr:10736_t:CDS:1 [Ambispora gerdemannii]